MKIKFKNTFIDILIFNASHQFRNIACQIFYIILSILIAHPTYIWTIESGKTDIAMFIGIFSFLISYIFIWLFQFLFNVLFLYSKKNKTVLTNHTVELQDNALYEETPYNKSYFYWNGVEQVKKISGYIAIYVTAHSAVIIPNKAFENAEAKNSFLERLNKLRSNA